jgi:hypothetical protein
MKDAEKISKNNLFFPQIAKVKLLVPETGQETGKENVAQRCRSDFCFSYESRLRGKEHFIINIFRKNLET